MTPLKIMKTASLVSFIALAIAVTLYHLSHYGVFKTLAVAAGTAFYHFFMRLVVGIYIDKVKQNRADITRSWYRIRPWETVFYQRIGVKNWKDKMPTSFPEYYDLRKHTPLELAQVTCQSEIIHEVNVLISAGALLGAVPFGMFPAFFLSSLAAGCFDMIFVMMQRYNRSRLMPLVERQRRAAGKTGSGTAQGNKTGGTL